jgi:mRNA interferase MazF
VTPARPIQRGEIWWTGFGQPRGSEPGYRHPVLVIQRDEVNQSRINTIVVCVLTSNTRLARAPGNTLLSKRQTGLRKDCVANASQIVTLNKDELERSAGTLPERLMQKVDAGLRWFLTLEL